LGTFARLQSRGRGPEGRIERIEITPHTWAQPQSAGLSIGALRLAGTGAVVVAAVGDRRVHTSNSGDGSVLA
jgi:hypothetical protein